jgi:hypothetical protein
MQAGGHGMGLAGCLADATIHSRVGRPADDSQNHQIAHALGGTQSTACRAGRQWSKARE